MANNNKNNRNRKNDPKGCLVGFFIFGGFITMMVLCIWLAKNDSGIITIIPFLSYVAIMVIGIGISNAISRKKKGNAAHNGSPFGDGDDSGLGKKDWTDECDKASDELFDMLCERCDDDTYDLIYNSWNKVDDGIIDDDNISIWDCDRLRYRNTLKCKRLIEFYSDSRSEEDPELIHITKEQMDRYLLQDDLCEEVDTETYEMLNRELCGLRSAGANIENIRRFQALIDRYRDHKSEDEPEHIHITESEMREFFAEYDSDTNGEKDRAESTQYNEEHEQTAANTAEKDITAEHAEKFVAPTETTAEETDAEKIAPQIEKKPSELKADPTLKPESPKGETASTEHSKNTDNRKRPTVGYRSIGKK